MEQLREGGLMQRELMPQRTNLGNLDRRGAALGLDGLKSLAALEDRLGHLDGGAVVGLGRNGLGGTRLLLAVKGKNKGNKRGKETARQSREWTRIQEETKRQGTEVGCPITPNPRGVRPSLHIHLQCISLEHCDTTKRAKSWGIASSSSALTPKTQGKKPPKLDRLSGGQPLVDHRNDPRSQGDEQAHNSS